MGSPTSPEIGYGYIKAERPFMDDEIIRIKLKSLLKIIWKSE